MNFKNTLMETLNIEAITTEKELVVLKMPVNTKTHQPMGFLHGGASVALAESAASLGAYLNINPEVSNIFGLEINSNHIKSKRDGLVYARAMPIHKGKSTMVWEIKVVDEDGDLISICRCTIGVTSKRK
ncbi:PaaI family thioesterase [Aquibacillus rhizosphaerae]|uniref:PaaI family thioesterase n=1 Tax=Aquibacillus rhizosphaerae TaxID=3051431 RepID=A0ABT7LAW5_9BACI|nr:PaaI family thioesterase [Aquibacillus sp. LR5S19]MDL4842554.1 PaaI family thioesterase [Aquibacillus sp. LR5S19]